MKPTLLTSIVYAWQKNMTPLKCVHLNSVTRFILITILVSIFSQSFDCKPTNSVTVGTSEQGNISHPIDPLITNEKPSRSNDTKGLGNISQPIDNDPRPQINLNYTLECTPHMCIYMAPPINNDRLSINDLNSKRLVLDLPTNDNFGNNTNGDKSYETDGPASPEKMKA